MVMMCPVNVPSCASVLLVRWRKQAGIIQEVAAKAVGVTQATWSGYESGRQVPRTEKALEIATLTGGAVPVTSWIEPAEAAGDEEPASERKPKAGKGKAS